MDKLEDKPSEIRLIILCVIESLIILPTLRLALWFRSLYHMSFFECLILFYAFMVAVTLLVLKILRTVVPLKEGRYAFSQNPRGFLHVRIQDFLLRTNLNLFYQNELIPPLWRKEFYRLLGAKMGKGIILISGKLRFPMFITLEEGVAVADDASLNPMEVTSQNEFILGRIHIKKGATIGEKAVVMPGVTVGENSMVSVLSVVPTFTQIPPNEVWAGNPAKKVGEVTSE